MKKTFDNIEYDTDAPDTLIIGSAKPENLANYLDSINSGYTVDTLIQAGDGKYFIHRVRDYYMKAAGASPDTHIHDEFLFSRSKEVAKDWAFDHLDPSKYIAHFGMPQLGTFIKNATYTLWFTDEQFFQLRRLAEMDGAESTSNLIVRIVVDYLENHKV